MRVRVEKMDVLGWKKSLNEYNELQTKNNRNGEVTLESWKQNIGNNIRVYILNG